MKFVITGEAGFIGRNLPAAFEKHGHTFVSLLNHSAFVCTATQKISGSLYWKRMTSTW